MTTDRTDTTFRPARRTIAKGAAWVVPTLALATAAPAFATSGPKPTVVPGAACKLPGESCDPLIKGYLFKFVITNPSAVDVYLYTDADQTMPAITDNLPDIALVFEVAKVTVGGVTTFYFPGDAIRIPAGASATIILNAGTNATSENLLDYVINVSWPWGHTLDMADDTDHLGDPVMFSFTGADTPHCKLCSP